MPKLSSEEVQRLIDDALKGASKPAAARNGKTKSTDSSKPDWLGKSIKGKGQGPLSILANVLSALRNDPSLVKAFAYDEMQRTTMLMQKEGRPIPSKTPTSFDCRSSCSARA